MVNYRINEAETIFEPYFDGGESYPNHEKYSLLSEYTVTYAPDVVATVKQTWCAVAAILEKQASSGYTVRMERQCDLDIREYDILRLYSAINKNIDVRISCKIDGKWVTAIEREGLDTTGEMDAEIHGEKITAIALEFRHTGGATGVATLKWMGLSNAKKQAEMEARTSPFPSDWKGCFLEGDVELKPLVGIYFGEEELKDLRVRLNQPPFLDMTNQLREIAKGAMHLEPESLIGEFVPNRHGVLVRDRDMKRPAMDKNAVSTMAFIGLLDEDREMLHMACRYMLSLAVMPHWSETNMGNLPGTTWHHRSFEEGYCCGMCALVMDWAGSLLTWHGRNIVYDALMMKGLPRLESDFHSVDYIRWMNQGIVFNYDRVLAYLVLAHRYPRYESCLLEAERDHREMIDNYIQPDGGTTEGPTYWNFTFYHAIVTVMLLARHHGKTLEEYAWDKLKKTGEFALALLSDYGDGSCMIPVNDAHLVRYHPAVYAVFSRLSPDPRWKKLYHLVMTDKENPIKPTLDSILVSNELLPAEGEIHSDGFASFDITGHTSLRRTTEDVGRVHCYLSGGMTIFAHAHSDKGEFLLDVDHHCLLIDRGVCSYEHPAVNQLPKAQYHNLFFPEAPEGQMAYNQNSRKPGAKVLRSSYENGVFDYCTDTTDAWQDGIFTSITRSVKSEDPHLYLIYDDAVMVEEIASSFRLNTRGEIAQISDTSWAILQDGYQVTVTPVNYTVTRAEFGEDSIDEKLRPVNLLKLFLAKAKEQHIVTLLEVSKIGAQKAKVLSENAIDYNGKIYTV